MTFFIGMDIGSVSFKAVIIDDKGAIVKSYYTKNKGVISTVKEVMKNLKFDGVIDGVGITGSGKEFVNLLVGGDVLESEIMSHAVASIKQFRDVRTIFDIGGEDSKLIIVKNGEIENFMMNQACGGGTGSMIEAIANRMGIAIEDVGDLALKSKNEVSVPSKCGIFAQSAVVSKLNKGMSREDILAGVCKGLIGNFLTMLGKGKDLKPPFVFQGATAQNKALVVAFEKELDEKVFVPEMCSFMGAYGAALLVQENKPKKSNFKGFELAEAELQTKTIIGDGCSNMCEITFIFNNKDYVGTIGNRCQRCPLTHLKKISQSIKNEKSGEQAVDSKEVASSRIAAN
ncbi:2-hydroxyglutaryl-CoA dehydratase [Candidatus Woesearchaeota archaeon]|nr:2-hydroxyglutaryl-CoA dehydratase [Candidatus Woesearchaeota archaeon]|tara:strand:+ start:10328 stop:11356 length:1029 start_codon:yes stop_codon:yes gene_type:complete